MLQPALLCLESKRRQAAALLGLGVQVVKPFRVWGMGGQPCRIKGKRRWLPAAARFA